MFTNRLFYLLVVVFLFVTACSSQRAEGLVWSAGLPPNGVWQVELTTDDHEQMGVNGTVAPDWNGVYTIKYQDGKAFLEREDPGLIYNCEADQEIVQAYVVRETYIVSAPIYYCLGAVLEYRWRLEDDGLHFRILSVDNGPLVEITAVMEARPWQKVDAK